MKPTITYPDFEKLELRIGQVVKANIPSWSDKLIELRVNFGESLGEKTIFAGVKQWYQPESFVGNKYIFVVNLAERKMGEGVSQGMMLMVDNEDKPLPIPVATESQLGAEVC